MFETNFVFEFFYFLKFFLLLFLSKILSISNPHGRTKRLYPQIIDRKAL